jgi:hypothetical protein
VADDTCQTIAVVASQLTRLRYELGPNDSELTIAPLITYCASGLSQRLQRLELPQVCLVDQDLVALCAQLPALSIVEVATFLLMENHANLACSWEEMVIAEVALGELLARLPLARAGRHGGVRKLTLRKIAVYEMTPAVSDGLANVCCSACQLSTMVDSTGVRKLHLAFYGTACLQAVTPLLSRFEPGSVNVLTLLQRSDEEGNEDLRLQAFTAFAAEVAAGHASLKDCKLLALANHTGHNWYTPAVCSALLPALMPSSIAAVSLHDFAADAAVAVCSPEALAAVTRLMAIGVGRDLDAATAMQAAINAAGKGHLLSVHCL